MCSEGHQVWRQDVSLLKSTLLTFIFLNEKLISKLVIHRRGKHLDCSRTLKPIDRIFIELSLTFHISLKSGRLVL